MPTAVGNIPRNQIQMLESGLKSLKQSKLITSRELHDMYTAIDNHHRDVSLAHLTGKPKDLLEQAKQDTKFFYILTKMLKEVLIGTHKEQEDNLREVYSWYQSNKHILHSAPKFGRQVEKSRHSAKSRIKSACRPGSGVSEVSSVRLRPRSSGIAKLGSVQKQVNDAMAKEMKYETDFTVLEELQNLQEQRIKEESYQYYNSAAHESSVSVTMSNLETASSPDFASSATKRISESQQHLLPRRSAQPLSHIFNPHVNDVNGGGDTAYHGQQQEVIEAPKSENLRKWQQFQQQYTYGQEVLSKLAHCGRTGVSGGVRYIAHEGGLAAEYMTPLVVSNYQNTSTQPKEKQAQKTVPEHKKSVLAEKSLEEFYSLSEGYYPAHLPKYPSFTRVQSAKSKQEQRTEKHPVSKPNSVHLDALKTSEANLTVQQSSLKTKSDTGRSGTVTFEESRTPTIVVPPLDLGSDLPSGEGSKNKVKLDNVVNMIDSVTEEMTYFKEKLLPPPRPGFRRPMHEVDPSEQAEITPIVGRVARPSSPDDDGLSVSTSGRLAPPQSTADPDYTALPSPPNSLHHQVDEKVKRPDSRASMMSQAHSRYRWQETPCGGRTYYRKQAGSSLRSAGTARAPPGGRPKTAPQTPREKWSISNPSENNKKAAVAASHTTTEVEEEVTARMLEVKHLGKKYGKQRRRFFFDYYPELRDRSSSAMNTATPSMQYLSFIAPKPVSRASSAVPRSRMGSAMDGSMSYQPLSDDNEEEDIKENDDNDSLNSYSNHLDIPDVNDLDDDLDDDFQYEGDEIIQEPFPEEDTLFNENYNRTILESDLDPSEVATTQGDEFLESEIPESSEQEVSSVQSNNAHDRDLLTGLDDGEETNSTSDKPQDSDDDFDSVNIQSSEHESDSGLNIIDQQMNEVKKISNEEINNLVQFQREVRPVSSHSRVTFQDEKLEETEKETGKKTEQAGDTAEGGRKVLKPKSILVPRHVYPPPNVGLTIVQFNRGDAQPADSTKLVIASESQQSLSKSEPVDPQLEEITSARAKAVMKQRQFANFMSKPVNSDLPVEDDRGLSVQGMSAKGKRRARSAGVVPHRARSATHIRVLQKQREMLRNSPATANRTAPSIPSAYQRHGAGQPESPFIPELEKHARKDQAARNLMHRVGSLRCKQDVMWVPSRTEQDDQGLLTTTLRIMKVKPGDRLTDTGGEEARQRHPGTPVSYFDESRPQSELRMANDSDSHEKTDAAGDKVTRVHLYPGRPIPEYGEAKTPEEYQSAVRTQNEAKAAVDIQRIFRGFLVRQNYKYLRFEERTKEEDKRKAAVEIQKAYRGHLVRKKQIYERKDLNPDMIEWAKNFKVEQRDRQRLRNVKTFEMAEQNARNKAEADAKISVIGPHVEVYVPFHPKKTGPDKSVLNAAATCIQRHMRGWIIRKHFQKIHRKSKQHASSWSKFIQHYRDVLGRVQRRHGNDRPKYPFSFDDVNEYMDVKKRYESGFEGLAYAGELEFDELPDYFHECDLFPSPSDVEHAIDVVFKGQDISKKRGLQRSQVLELTFHLYPPAATGITNARKSTWMNPIIDGEEAVKLMGTEGVEPTDFATVWKLVASTRKQQQEAKDLAEKDKKDAEHALLMEEKRKRDLQLRDELRKMGTAGYRGKDYAKKKTQLEAAEGEETSPKKDKKVHFTDETKQT